MVFFSKSTARIDLEKHQTRLHYWGISLCNFGESPLQFWVFLLYTKQTRSFAKDYRERQHGLNVQDINEIVNEKIRLRKSHLFVLKKADYTYKYSVIRYPEGVL